MEAHGQEEAHPPQGPENGDPGVEVSHVRGVILTVVKSTLEEGLDPGGWDAFLARLRPETAQLFRREVTDYEWVPMSALTEAAAAHPAGQERDLPLLRGAIYADRMLTRNHQWMLRVMTPELLVRQCPRIFAFYHLGGEMQVEELAPGRARISLRARGPGWGWFSVLLPTWLGRSLQLCGAASPSVVHEAPAEDGDPDLHRYRLSWG